MYGFDSVPFHLCQEHTMLTRVQGVGETLRGTFNNTVDQNFPRKNDKKAAKANAKNDAVLARGREEVSAIPGRGGHRPVPPIPPQQPPSGGGYTHLPQEHPPPPPSATGGVPPSLAPPVKPPSPQRTATSEQTVPGMWSPEYDGAEGGVGPDAGTAAGRDREREKSKSISKLFKRKPVTAKEGELRVTNP